MRALISLTVLILVGALLLAEESPAGVIKGKVTAKRVKDLTNTVVFLDSIPGDFKPPKEHVLMNQKNLVFIPHVLPVLAGTTVDFLNSDDVAHNVFTPDESAAKFNLGTWPTGEIRSYTFERRCAKACDAVMLCNVHPEMEAFVVIMQNPYFAKVDDSGFYQIEGVPAGTYTVAVWHPKQQSPPARAVVPGEGTVEVNFGLQKK
jgi:plastocyanin